HFRALFRIEQARTMAKVSAKRAADAERNLGSAATELERLAHRFGDIPMYKTGQARALLVRGELRAADGRAAEARDDFQSPGALLNGCPPRHPPPAGAPGPPAGPPPGPGRLPRAAGEGATARTESAAAAASLRRATTLSPDDAEDRRSLSEVLAELK